MLSNTAGQLVGNPGIVHPMLANAQPYQPARVATNGGGQNAQGTPNAFGGQGMFQYGQGQYGSVNAGGQVNWNQNQAAWDHYLQNHRALDAQHVLNVAHAQGLSHPHQNARAPYYLDSLYATSMLPHIQDNASAQATGSKNLADINQQFANWQHDAAITSAQTHNHMSTDLASRGIDPGQYAGAQTMIDQNIQNQNSVRDATQKYQSDTAGEKTNMAKAALDLAQWKTQLQGVAKETYDKSGQTPPKENLGFYKQGKQWYYTNKNGVTITVAHGPQNHKGKK